MSLWLEGNGGGLITTKVMGSSLLAAKFFCFKTHCHSNSSTDKMYFSHSISTIQLMRCNFGHLIFCSCVQLPNTKSTSRVQLRIPHDWSRWIMT